MSTPEPPRLTGRRVVLRPVSSDDYPILYQWEADVETLYLWRQRALVPRYDEFVQNLRGAGSDGTHVQMMVLRRNTSACIGTVYSFDVSMVNGYASLGVYLSEAHTYKGLGVEAGYLFVNYLMSYYPFRKLYTDVYSYNEHSLQVATKIGFVVEGTLKAHRWFGDRYWDLHKLALYRDAWQNIKTTLAPLVGTTHSRDGDQTGIIPRP
jgi:RimJ/RimL family protein N-acetyltransferase